MSQTQNASIKNGHNFICHVTDNRNQLLLNNVQKESKGSRAAPTQPRATLQPSCDKELRKPH